MQLFESYLMLLTVLHLHLATRVGNHASENDRTRPEVWLELFR